MAILTAADEQKQCDFAAEAFELVVTFSGSERPMWISVG
jgi:hypothetical protein